MGCKLCVMLSEKILVGQTVLQMSQKYSCAIPPMKEGRVSTCVDTYVLAIACFMHMPEVLSQHQYLIMGVVTTVLVLKLL